MRNLLADDLDHVLASTGALWEELRRARVFVTGGTGFVGCWLLETLLWANDTRQLGVSVTLLTRDPESLAAKAPHLARHPAVTLRTGDVRSLEHDGSRHTHVVHAATDARASNSPADRQAAFDTIVLGTRRALDFAGRCGARRFLLTSSGAVYGRQPSSVTHVHEDSGGGPDPTAPDAFYAEGKRAAEMLCALHATSALEPVIARCFAFVGPYLPLDWHFAVGNFLRDALDGGPIRIAGDGTPYRSYLYAADLASWLWTMLLHGAPMRPYNVGSEQAVSIEELAHAVAQQVSPPARVERARSPEPGARAERYVPSTARARAELGVRETVTLDEALRRTMAWHRAARAGTARAH